MAIVRGARVRRALAEQRVGLVEQQHDVAGLRGIEDLGEVLLGLADPLRHHLRQVDLVDREPELVRDHRRAHRLADPGRSGEQHRHAGRPVEAPLLADATALADRGDHLAQHRLGVGIRDHVIERVRGRQRFAEALQPPVELVADGQVERVEARVVLRARAHGARRHVDDAPDDRVARCQLGRDLVQHLWLRALPQLDAGVEVRDVELEVDDRPHPQRRQLVALQRDRDRPAPTARRTCRRTAASRCSAGSGCRRGRSAPGPRRSARARGRSRAASPGRAACARAGRCRGRARGGSSARRRSRAACACRYRAGPGAPASPARRAAPTRSCRRARRGTARAPASTAGSRCRRARDRARARRSRGTGSGARSAAPGGA